MRTRMAGGVGLGLAVVLATVWVLVSPGPAAAADFSNPSPIAVPLGPPPPGCPTTCPSEKATSFPSTIAVAGLSGPVTDVNVILRNVTYQHNGLADADVLVVAPGGKAVMVMSDACGDDANAYPVTNPVTLTFDDQAGGSLPADGACPTGTYRPLDDDDDGEFPFHVADGITGGPQAPAGTRPLADFNGIDGNGTWSLYLVDDYPNDPDPAGRAGEISGGWTIQIASAAPATAPPPVTAPAATTAPAVTTRPGPATTRVPGATTVPGPAVTTATAPSSSTTLDPLLDIGADTATTEVATRATSSSKDDDDPDPLPLAGAVALLLASGLFATRALKARRSLR